MISPSDLRIGNWFMSVKWNKPVQCHLTDLYELCILADGATDDPPIDKIFTPIPLTEQWLVKLGFKKWGRDDMPRTISYELPEMNIFPANDFCDFKGYGFMHYKPDKNKAGESARFKFNYVHDLQNLYKALTGSELSLSPSLV